MYEAFYFIPENARECKRARTGPRFVGKEFLGNGVRTHVNSKGKIPTGSSEEDGTRDAASRRTASPIHYRLSYSGPYSYVKLSEFSVQTPTTDTPKGKRQFTLS